MKKLLSILLLSAILLCSCTVPSVDTSSELSSVTTSSAEGEDVTAKIGGELFEKMMSVSNEEKIDIIIYFYKSDYEGSEIYADRRTKADFVSRKAITAQEHMKRIISTLPKWLDLENSEQDSGRHMLTAVATKGEILELCNNSNISDIVDCKKNEISAYVPPPLILDKETYTPNEKLGLNFANDSTYNTCALSYERIEFFDGKEWVIMHSADGTNTYHEPTKEDLPSNAIYFEPQEGKHFNGPALSVIENPISGKYRVSYLMGEDAVDGNGNDVVSIICNIFVEFTLTVE